MCARSAPNPNPTPPIWDAHGWRAETEHILHALSNVDHDMTSSTAASQTELKAAKVPIGWRDQCSAYVALIVNCCYLPMR